MELPNVDGAWKSVAVSWAVEIGAQLVLGRDLFTEMLIIDFEALMLHPGSSQELSAAKRHHSLALKRDGTCLRAAGRGVEICMSPTFCVVETCSSTCCDLVTTWL